jgi:hypothetical protein
VDEGEENEEEEVEPPPLPATTTARTKKKRTTAIRRQTDGRKKTRRLCPSTPASRTPSSWTGVRRVALRRVGAFRFLRAQVERRSVEIAKKRGRDVEFGISDDFSLQILIFFLSPFLFSLFEFLFFSISLRSTTRTHIHKKNANDDT